MLDTFETRTAIFPEDWPAFKTFITQAHEARIDGEGIERIATARRPDDPRIRAWGHIGPWSWRYLAPWFTTKGTLTKWLQPTNYPVLPLSALPEAYHKATSWLWPWGQLKVTRIDATIDTDVGDREIMLSAWAGAALHAGAKNTADWYQGSTQTGISVMGRELSFRAYDKLLELGEGPSTILRSELQIRPGSQLFARILTHYDADTIAVDPGPALAAIKARYPNCPPRVGLPRKGTRMDAVVWAEHPKWRAEMEARLSRSAAYALRAAGEAYALGLRPQAFDTNLLRIH